MSPGSHGCSLDWLASGRQLSLWICSSFLGSHFLSSLLGLPFAIFCVVFFFGPLVLTWKSSRQVTLTYGMYGITENDYSTFTLDKFGCRILIWESLFFRILKALLHCHLASGIAVLKSSHNS